MARGGEWVRRFLLAVTLVFLLSMPVLALTAQPVTAKNIDINGEKNIGVNSWEVLASFRALNNARLVAEMRVTGPPGTNYTMDFLLLDVENYNLYRNNQSFNVVPGSSLKTDHLTLNISLQSGMGYYLVADNTDQPSGGAYAHPSVQCSAVGIAKDCGALKESNPSNGLIMVAGIGVISAAMIILLLLIRRNPR